MRRDFKVLIAVLLQVVIMVSCQDEVVDFYKLTTNYISTEGSVTLIPNRAEYSAGETVLASAVAKDGYLFQEWSGDVGDSDRYSSNISVDMDGDRDITALFMVDEPFSLTINYNDTYGSVTILPVKSSYGIGDTITVTAVANSGYKFSEWQGDISSLLPSVELVLTQSLNIECLFEVDSTQEDPFTLTVNYNATHGSVEVSPVKTSYGVGDTVTVTAIANSGYKFSEWQGDISSELPSIGLILTQNVNIECLFEVDSILNTPSTLTINYNATYGSVGVSPVKTSYSVGDTVTVTAVANSGYKFSGWQGDISSLLPSVELILTQDLNLECLFEEDDNTVSGLPTVIIDGSFNKETQKWNFEATVDLSDEIDDNYLITIDGEEMSYSSSFDSYELKNISRSDIDSPLSIEISHSTIATTSYTVTPKNFADVDNISYENSEAGDGFSLSWTNLDSDSYRIFRRVSSSDASLEGTYADGVTDTNYSFLYSGIWDTPNMNPSSEWDTFFIWVVPVETVPLDEIFSEASRIEISGQRSSLISGKR